MASWAVVLDNPASLGYEDDGYELPELYVHEIVVDKTGEDVPTLSLLERRRARKASLESRCRAAADLVNASNEQWLVWCDLNDESTTLKEMIDLAEDVKGSDKATRKQGMIRLWFWIPKMFGNKAKYRRIRNELAKLPQYDICWAIR